MKQESKHPTPLDVGVVNYKIIHKTEYGYSDSVNLCYNEARLTPRNFVHQHCSSSQFVVDPEPGACRERQDFFGNTVAPASQ